jgi:glutamate---cysteine ligase / carboxylate-amine ligase
MHPLTFGVEEEFLLVDAESFRLRPAARAVTAALPPDVAPFVRYETRATQIELATPVLTRLGELPESLAFLRAALDSAAREHGCRLLASGTGILPDARRFPLADQERYGHITEAFGDLEDPWGVCACHVHVGVPDRATAVEVLNRIRVWLPVIQALSCNSPFLDGRDTGYASWRSALIGAWPTVGPSPLLRSIEHHDEIVADLLENGVMLDPQMLYWHARISATYPTVEVRAGDVCMTIAETTLVAAVARALVATALRDAAAGTGLVPTEEAVLRAAHWLAGRDGFEGWGFDPTTRTRVLMRTLVDSLVEHVSEALAEHGDLNTVRALLAGLDASGSGAARQRAAAVARPGMNPDPDLSSVARFVVAQTAGEDVTGQGSISQPQPDPPRYKSRQG